MAREKEMNADEVKGTVNDSEKLSTEQETIIHQREEIDILMQNQAQLIDRLNRVESIQNQNKLRKYDEINDPASQRKTGRIPSMDGKDPIIEITRKGASYIDNNQNVHDEQVIKVKTLGGAEKSFDLLQFNSACSGNSIPCVVNDWEALMERQKVLAKKYHEFQRSTGKTAKSNTVELLKEIKEMEKTISINVTLSEDYGKTFTGKTIDVPWQHVFNAIS